MQIPFKLMYVGQLGSFKFGEKKHFGLGLLLIRIPIKEDYFLYLFVLVVDVDVP